MIAQVMRQNQKLNLGNEVRCYHTRGVRYEILDARNLEFDNNLRFGCTRIFLLGGITNHLLKNQAVEVW
jgi:hypothetical protein